MSLHKQGRSLEELRALMHTEQDIIRHAFEVKIKNIDLADPNEKVSKSSFKCRVAAARETQTHRWCNNTISICGTNSSNDWGLQN